jgi:hypothetical protein
VCRIRIFREWRLRLRGVLFFILKNSMGFMLEVVIDESGECTKGVGRKLPRVKREGLLRMDSGHI